MNSKTEKNKSFLDVCYNLRKNLANYADDSGCLFPEMDLCKMLSASRGTVRKALDELRSEGVIYSQKRRNYINENKRRREIGILMDCFKPAPYLPATDTFTALLKELDKYGCHGRMLVPADIKAVPDLVKQYDLMGVIWLDPPEASFPAIAEMVEQENMKSSCLITYCELPEDCPLKYNYVTMDREHHGRTRAEYMISKGHERVICLSKDDIVYRHIIHEMEKNGFKQSPKWRLETPEEVNKKLLKIMKRHNIKSIISNGGAIVEALFDVLAKVDNPSGIDIQIPISDKTINLMKKYPQLKVAKVAELGAEEFGIQVVKMLMRFIKQQQDQEPFFVKSRFFNPEEIIG